MWGPTLGPYMYKILKFKDKLLTLALQKKFYSIFSQKICLWWFNFRLKPIYTTAPAAFKNDAQFKTGADAIKKFTPSLGIPSLGV